MGDTNPAESILLIKLNIAKEALFLASRHTRLRGEPCSKVVEICIKALKDIEEINS